MMCVIFPAKNKWINHQLSCNNNYILQKYIQTAPLCNN